MLTKLTENYISEVAEIERLCFGSDAWSKESILSSLEKSYCTFEVLIVDSEVVGYYSYYNIAGEAYINNVAVHPKHQNKGYGTKLINSLIEKAKKEASAITLEVRASNIIAQKLYEKAGFEKVGIRPKFYNNTEDGVIYWYKTEG